MTKGLQEPEIRENQSNTVSSGHERSAPLRRSSQLALPVQDQTGQQSNIEEEDSHDLTPPLLSLGSNQQLVASRKSESVYFLQICDPW